MIKDSNSGAVWCRWIQSACAVGVLALFTACSGGGGGAGSPKPHFEKTTFDGFQAVRDNITGNVWAAQLGSVGPNDVTPKAEALLAIADLPEDVRQEYFSFVNGNNVFKASNPVNPALNSVWAVDFGNQSVGGLRTEASNETNLKTWVLLQEGSLPTTPFLNLNNGTVNQGGNLQWSLCTLGAVYDSNQYKCTGTPRTYSLADAKTQASSSVWAGKTGWRLPTKFELQSLLLLSGAVNSQPMLVSPFADKDVLDNSLPMEYWTSTVYPLTKLPWVVDFAGNNAPGGVRTITIDNTSTAYVRLVRDL